MTLISTNSFLSFFLEITTACTLSGVKTFALPLRGFKRNEWFYIWENQKSIGFLILSTFQNLAKSRSLITDCMESDDSHSGGFEIRLRKPAMALSSPFRFHMKAMLKRRKVLKKKTFASSKRNRNKSDKFLIRKVSCTSLCVLSNSMFSSLLCFYF